MKCKHEKSYETLLHMGKNLKENLHMGKQFFLEQEEVILE